MNPYTFPGIRRNKESESDKVKRKVKEYYRCDLKENIWARQVAMWIIRKKLRKTWRETAGSFGASEASARHGVRRVEEEVVSYEQRKNEVSDILKGIFQ